MDVFFLEARVRLCKTFQSVSGQLVKHPYPHAAEFRSHKASVNTPQDLYVALQHHAALGHCLLKGTLQKPLNFESRAGSTTPDTPTQWFVLDLDGIRALQDVEHALTILGFGDVTYIVQYSASMGVLPKKGLSCHVFMLLDREVSPTQLKLLVMHKNFKCFRSELVLTRTNSALRWPLDVTVNQNDKLIFITPPICVPKTLDTFQGERIVYVKRAKDFLSLNDADFPNAELLRKEQNDLINALRKDQNLEPRKNFLQKTDGAVQYLANPGVASVTSVKKERGFVYLNLNGGDSWGYWHPEDNATYLYNFKGEPTYKTQEIVPDYWYSLQAQKRDKGKTYLAVSDNKTASYVKVIYDHKADTVQMYPARTKEQLQDFMAQYGLPKPKEIEDWAIVYEPDNDFTIDLEGHRINRFIPSAYMRAPNLVSGTYPLHIHELLRSVLGEEDGLRDHFINWLACVLRRRVAAGTAWILQGVPGTGKGLLIHEVVKRILGPQNVSCKRMEEFEDKFNEHLEETLLCYVDEVNVGVSRRADMIMANLKNQITEPVITIRRMRLGAYEVKNYVNWVFSTNMREPIIIEPDDRRFNVGEFCQVPLTQRVPDLNVFVKALNDELPHFVAELYAYKIDPMRAKRPYENLARSEIIQRGLTSNDVIARLLQEGDLQKLYSFLPTDTMGMNGVGLVKAKACYDLLTDLVHTGREVITRDELHTLFSYLCGNVSDSPIKFTQFLGHQGIEVIPLHSPTLGRTVRGIKVKWNVDETWLVEVRKVVPIRGMS